MTANWGQLSEEAARRYAAEFGVPDFVYDPVILPKGTGSREVSDGLLISRERGIILQSKSRDRAAAADSSSQIAWARRRIVEAARQVRGTRRTLASVSELQLISRRGHSLTLSADSERIWPGVVLLDLPDCPSGIDATCEDPAAIVMTLNDWYALNHRIRSTCGVIDYVHRVIDARPVYVELTDEATRYDNFAAADEELVRREGGYPILPSKGLSLGEEQILATFDDWIDSDIAVATGPNGNSDPEATRRAVEVIDAIPVAMRVEIAQNILDRVRKADIGDHAVSGLVHLPLARNRLLFFFDRAINWSSHDHFATYAFDYAATRHEELNDLYGPGGSLLLARMSFESGHVFRTFVFIEGTAENLEPPSEARRSILERHGMLTSGGIRPMERLQRGDP